MRVVGKDKINLEQKYGRLYYKLISDRSRERG
jgi:hypothetical protein